MLSLDDYVNSIQSNAEEKTKFNMTTFHSSRVDLAIFSPVVLLTCNAFVPGDVNSESVGFEFVYRFGYHCVVLISSVDQTEHARNYKTTCAWSLFIPKKYFEFSEPKSVLIV